MASFEYKMNIDMQGLYWLYGIAKELGKYHIKIGVLSGSKMNRNDGKTNAEIGMKHEFGSRSERIPRRSFLVDPLTVWHADKIIQFLKDKHEDIIMKALFDFRFKGFDKPIKRIYTKLGMFCKQIIDDAFASNGFGQWLPLSKYTIKKKGHSRILIETEQLRRSITFRTDKGS